jgi:hypothetical protein
MPKSNI